MGNLASLSTSISDSIQQTQNVLISEGRLNERIARELQNDKRLNQETKHCLLVGTPGSGKETIIRQLSQIHNSSITHNSKFKHGDIPCELIASGNDMIDEIRKLILFKVSLTVKQHVNNHKTSYNYNWNSHGYDDACDHEPECDGTSQFGKNRLKWKHIQCIQTLLFKQTYASNQDKTDIKNVDVNCNYDKNRDGYRNQNNKNKNMNENNAVGNRSFSFKYMSNDEMDYFINDTQLMDKYDIICLVKGYIHQKIKPLFSGGDEENRINRIRNSSCNYGYNYNHKMYDFDLAAIAKKRKNRSGIVISTIPNEIENIICQYTQQISMKYLAKSIKYLYQNHSQIFTTNYKFNKTAPVEGNVNYNYNVDRSMNESLSFDFNGTWQSIPHCVLKNTNTLNSINQINTLSNTKTNTNTNTKNYDYNYNLISNVRSRSTSIRNVVNHKASESGYIKDSNMSTGTSEEEKEQFENLNLPRFGTFGDDDINYGANINHDDDGDNDHGCELIPIYKCSDNDNILYFLNKIESLFDENYQLTSMDYYEIPKYARVIYKSNSREYHNKLIDSRLKCNIEGINFHFHVSSYFDINNPNNSKKWRKLISYFDMITALIYVASLAEFDSIEQMSLQLSYFESIYRKLCVSNEIACILLFNKCDIFQHKIEIEQIMLQTSYPQFQGNNNYHECLEFVISLFMAINNNCNYSKTIATSRSARGHSGGDGNGNYNRNGENNDLTSISMAALELERKDKKWNFYRHVLSAKDKNLVKKVFSDVRHSIIASQLIVGGLL